MRKAVARAQPDYEEFSLLNIDKPKYPEPYELMTLLLHDGKTVSGWFDGYRWTGYRFKAEMNVVGWKRRWM